MKSALIGFSLLGAVGVGYMLGRGHAQSIYLKDPNGWEVYPDPITVDQAIEYLIQHKASHQYYIDHPKEINESTGDIEFQRLVVARYTQIISLLEGCK